MGKTRVFAIDRISGWVLSFIVFATVLALSGALPRVVSDGRVALAVFLGMAIAGELLGRFHTRTALARQEEMRAIIRPFYATLQRTVQAQEDDPPGGGEREYAFDAATATVVEDEEQSFKDEVNRFVYEIKRYARSPEGEYFWMILEVVEGAPRLVFIKHVAHNVARYALQGKYVPPPPRFA